MKYVLGLIAQQIRDRVWEEAGAALGLVSCVRVTRPLFKAPDPQNIATAFPAVGVIARGWRRAAHDDDWQIGAIRGTYTIDLVYVCQVDPRDAAPLEPMEAALRNLAGLWAPEDLRLWWQSIDGYTAESILIAETLEPEDPEELAAGLFVASGVLSLQVSGFSHPIGPVSYPARRM